MAFSFAIVGATGLVGRTMLKVLEERNVEIGKLKLLASKRSAGKSISFKGEDYVVEELTENSFKDVDIALFSAGGETSKYFAPFAAKDKAIVIDNSSAWRMDENCPLVVPEVNPEALKNHNYIIANPNCSTMQLVVALKPIMDNFGLDSIICSTYQSISGAGQKGVDKLTQEINDHFYSDGSLRIAYNTLFHPLESNGNTNEENKMHKETRKILGTNDIKTSFTCVRLPILGGHGESVQVKVKNDTTLSNMKEIIKSGEGIELIEEGEKFLYPTTQDAENSDFVYVGRVRKEPDFEKTFDMWIVSDNLRKGAATNAVQIAIKMIEMGLVAGK